MAPVDPVSIHVGFDRNAQKKRELLRSRWHLDESIYDRYLAWAIPMFTELDFGDSWTEDRPVADIILPLIEKTVLLFGFAFFVTIIISTITGIVAAVNHNSFFDQSALFGTLVGFSVPNFVLGLLIQLAAVALFGQGFIPVYQGHIHHSILGKNGYWPILLMATLTIIIGGTAFLTRLVRSSMLNVLRENYIKTARAKGLPERTVIYKHALRNALLPFVTIVALSLPGILGGSAVIEQVFNYPGVGTQIVKAAQRYDMPVILAVNMFFGTMSIMMLLVAEIIYAVVDPRIQF
jgi:peptide/nickel transport system permease protein